MKIVCNGSEREVAPGTRLAGLLTELGLAPDSVVAECDGVILKRDDYESHELTEGSVVELIRFVGGG
ncbi:MAG: sulfur carrier protein ThiS [Thermodesulfobacteriota bacterium]